MSRMTRAREQIIAFGELGCLTDLDTVDGAAHWQFIDGSVIFCH
jgi:hypothetical protein